jgi:hypothetical protein
LNVNPVNVVSQLEEHFQKSFMELREVGAAITAVEFYLSHNLGIVKLLAETAIIVLDKARCQNDPV